MSVNKSMIREGMNIVDKNKNIVGYVTSGCYSPILNKSIGIGLSSIAICCSFP